MEVMEQDQIAKDVKEKKQKEDEMKSAPMR